MTIHHPYSGVLKVVSIGIYLLLQSIVFVADSGAELAPSKGEPVAGILVKMKAVYARVEDYQMQTEVKVYHEGKIC